MSCTSADVCDAVGNYGSSAGDGTFGESWNGTTWDEETISVPGNGNLPTLDSLSCVTTSSPTCFAVGYKAQTSYKNVLVDQLSGNTWAAVQSPEVAIPIEALNGVSCPSTEHCEAVGVDATESDGYGQGIATRWSGSSWLLQKTQLPYYLGWDPLAASLQGVSCTATGTATATDCLAVGSGASLDSGSIYEPVPWVEQLTGSGFLDRKHDRSEQPWGIGRVILLCSEEVRCRWQAERP